MRMIVVRHGQSEANANRVLQGHMDSPLSNQGRLQARKLTQRMINTGNSTFDLMYSSDLSRAVETAKIISQPLKIDRITYLPLLRELNLGIYEGLSLNGVNEKGLLDSIRNDYSKQVPGGESINSMIQRIHKFLEIISNLNPQPLSLLVITHGGALYHILRILTGFVPDDGEWYENCQMNELIKTADSSWKLITFNEKKLI